MIHPLTLKSIDIGIGGNTFITRSKLVKINTVVSVIREVYYYGITVYRNPKSIIKNHQSRNLIILYRTLGLFPKKSIHNGYY